MNIIDSESALAGFFGGPARPVAQPAGTRVRMETRQRFSVNFPHNSESTLTRSGLYGPARPVARPAGTRVRINIQVVWSARAAVKNPS